MSAQGNAGSRASNSELWGGIVGLGLGAFVVWAARDLGLGTINDPGSGFVLFYTGLLMCLFAGTIIYAALTEGGSTVRSLWAGASWAKPVIIIIALTVYAFVLEPLGVLLTTSPLMLILLRAVEPVAWRLAVPIGFCAPIIVWAVLKHALRIQLPSGMFAIG